MKYWQIIQSSYNRHNNRILEERETVVEPVTEETVKPKESEVKPATEESIKKIISEDVSSIIRDELSSWLNKIPEAAPIGLEDTVLDDEEIGDITTIILEYKNKYFPDLVMSDIISKMFLWNIPRSVYDTARYMYERDESDYLNPLFWFVAFCVDLTPSKFCRVFLQAIDNLTEFDHTRATDIMHEEYETDEEENNVTEETNNE